MVGFNKLVGFRWFKLLSVWFQVVSGCFRSFQLIPDGFSLFQVVPRFGNYGLFNVCLWFTFSNFDIDSEIKFSSLIFFHTCSKREKNGISECSRFWVNWFNKLIFTLLHKKKEYQEGLGFTARIFVLRVLYKRNVLIKESKSRQAT